jgi:AcrR family transcriptional regulator
MIRYRITPIRCRIICLAPRQYGAVSQICNAGMGAEIDTQAWIEAGLKELASSGVGGVRVEVLAQRLGVTKGGFYRRFKDRRALLNAVLDEWARGRILAINRVREQTESQSPSERLSSVARHYTERLSVHGMAIELAIRQWARTDSAAAAACASVDDARLKVAGRLYRDLGFSPAESRERAILLYSFLFGQSLLFVEYGPRKFASLTDAGTGLLMGFPPENRTRKGTSQPTAGRGRK